MELIIVLLLIGAGIYFFIKSNTNRGAETVRAHVFLGGIHAGATKAEANHAASFDIANGPTEVIQSALIHLKAGYGGKQLPMIADAYRQGMHPKLPSWYRTLARLHTAGSGHGPIVQNDDALQNRNSLDAYLRTIVNEVKRLDGKSDNELHWIELTDFEEGAKRAYADGVDPKALAAALVRRGPPDPSNVHP